MTHVEEMTPKSESYLEVSHIMTHKRGLLLKIEKRVLSIKFYEFLQQLLWIQGCVLELKIVCTFSRRFFMTHIRGYAGST